MENLSLEGREKKGANNVFVANLMEQLFFKKTLRGNLINFNLDATSISARTPSTLLAVLLEVVDFGTVTYVTTTLVFLKLKRSSQLWQRSLSSLC